MRIVAVVVLCILFSGCVTTATPRADQDRAYHEACDRRAAELVPDYWHQFWNPPTSTPITGDIWILPLILVFGPPVRAVQTPAERQEIYDEMYRRCLVIGPENSVPIG